MQKLTLDNPLKSVIKSCRETKSKVDLNAFAQELKELLPPGPDKIPLQVIDQAIKNAPSAEIQQMLQELKKDNQHSASKSARFDEMKAKSPSQAFGFGKNKRYKVLLFNLRKKMQRLQPI
jgi:hypothetical protein